MQRIVEVETADELRAAIAGVSCGEQVQIDMLGHFELTGNLTIPANVEVCLKYRS